MKAKRQQVASFRTVPENNTKTLDGLATSWEAMRRLPGGCAWDKNPPLPPRAAAAACSSPCSSRSSTALACTRRGCGSLRGYFCWPPVLRVLGEYACARLHAARSACAYQAFALPTAPRVWPIGGVLPATLPLPHPVCARGTPGTLDFPADTPDRPHAACGSQGTPGTLGYAGG